MYPLPLNEYSPLNMKDTIWVCVLLGEGEELQGILTAQLLLFLWMRAHQRLCPQDGI